jgi:hypothetical protein
LGAGSVQDHLSVVTLLGSPSRQTSPIIDSLALRKADGSFHPRHPGKGARNASESAKVTGQLAGMGIGFKFSAPAQPDEKMVLRLAGMQIQALYSLVTTRDYKNLDSLHVLPANAIWLFRYFPKTDWGNAQFLELIRRTQIWPCFAIVRAGEGHFRAVLRRERTQGEWFWAIEWNQSLRVIGAIGEPGAAPQLFASLPELDWMISPGGRIHEEKSLGEQPDSLFNVDVDELTP